MDRTTGQPPALRVQPQPVRAEPSVPRCQGGGPRMTVHYEPWMVVGPGMTYGSQPWTLEEFNLDLSPDPEDVDLDAAPWAPCRPTYGVSAGAETAVHTLDAELPAWFLRDVWDGADADGEHPGRYDTPQLAVQPRRQHRQCYMCGQLFKVDLADEHYTLCKEETTSWQD